MSERMKASRLEWWQEQRRSGKLGSNFESLIRDFETEREEVERLRKELAARPLNGFHHPDCNWWKWDWRYTWDDTDCTCDNVAGPLLAEAQGQPDHPSS